MKPRTLLTIAAVFGVVAVILLQMESWRPQGGTVSICRATREGRPPSTLKGAYEVVSMPANTYASMASQVPTLEFERWVTSTPVVRSIGAGETITFDALQRSAESGLQIAA